MDKELKEMLENLLINLNIATKGINNFLEKVNNKQPETVDIVGMLTLEKFERVFPNLKQFYCEDVLFEFAKHIENPDFGFTTKKRLFYFLAQIGHESGGLAYFSELANGSAYEGRKDLGNTQSGDGIKYKGRSPIQLTGKYNYFKFNEYLKTLDIDLDVFITPELVANNLLISCLCPFYFWQREGLHKYADNDDFKGLTKAINGGLNHLDRRVEYLVKVKSILES